jgi:hypothetical protein
MLMSGHPAPRRAATLLFAALSLGALSLFAALAAVAPPADAAPSIAAAPRSFATPPAHAAAPTPRQIERFWTPRRIAAARSLEMSVGRDRRADVRRRAVAGAAYSVVETPEAPPFADNGRLYVVQDGREGFCSATAIDSASRSLVLTAGHCVNTGPRHGRPGAWSSHLEFVPGFDLGTAPYGTFALAGTPRALPQWTREGNPDFDLGAFLVAPNAEGVALADAVGGGATIVMDQGREQRFETFGYPGAGERMRTCVSGYAGQDPFTFGFPGPPTVAVRCLWPPGGSGGGWLLDAGQEIDGLNSYTRAQRTYGPYFSAATVGRLVAGL